MGDTIAKWYRSKNLPSRPRFDSRSGLNSHPSEKMTTHEKKSGIGAKSAEKLKEAQVLLPPGSKHPSTRKR